MSSRKELANAIRALSMDARTAGTEPILCRVAAVALPGLRSYDLSLIYSLFLLKLPVLTASKSLRRSRQAGAARMDAG
ncbi:hypothetical protein MOQ76_21115 [Klebsiella pneumoniae]|nr:hypothetical protein MOQ76_21115 [Klebsiella pneumoniae]